MKKLVLNLEDLDVKTFEPAPALDEIRGTVRGAEETDGCSQYCSPTVFEYIWYQTWLQDR